MMSKNERICIDTSIFSEVDLNLMVTFVVIYEESSISRAAEKLGVTQPAISNALVKLRAHFDDLLFERIRYGMKPTSHAECIFQAIRPALTSIQAVLKNERFIAEG